MNVTKLIPVILLRRCDEEVRPVYPIKYPMESVAPTLRILADLIEESMGKGVTEYNVDVVGSILDKCAASVKAAKEM